MRELVGREGDYLVYRMRIYDATRTDPFYMEWRVYSPVTTTGRY